LKDKSLKSDMTFSLTSLQVIKNATKVMSQGCVLQMCKKIKLFGE